MGQPSEHFGVHFIAHGHFNTQPEPGTEPLQRLKRCCFSFYVSSCLTGKEQEISMAWRETLERQYS